MRKPLLLEQSNKDISRTLVLSHNLSGTPAENDWNRGKGQLRATCFRYRVTKTIAELNIGQRVWQA